METKFFAFPCDKQSRCLKYRDKHGVHRFGKSRGGKGARQGPTILCQLFITAQFCKYDLSAT